MTSTEQHAESQDKYAALPPGAAEFFAAAPWRRIVVLGDSVAAGVREAVPGYRDLDGIARVAEAVRAAHPETEYHNLGVRDVRITAVRAHQLTPAIDLRPDLAVVAAGGNDALPRAFDEEHIAAELTEILGALRAAGASLVTIGLFDLARSGLVPQPHADRLATRFDRLDELTERTVTGFGGVHTANHRHPLAADRGIYSSDGIHCNTRGHAVAAVTLTEALMRL